MSSKRNTSAPPPAPSPAAKRPTDSRGNVRIYADIPAPVARAFSILAARKEMAKKDLLAEIVSDACAGID